MNGEEEMSFTDKKENTKIADTEMDNNSLKQPPLHEQYENGVHLALMLFEWCIERVTRFPDDDTGKRVLDAITKARTKPVPMRSLNVTMEKRDSYELYVEVCSKLVMIASDMVRFELADIHDVETAIIDFMYWDQFQTKIRPRIVGCLNSMLYGYYAPPPQSTENDKQ